MTEETKHIYLFCPRVGMKYIPVYDSIRSFPPGEYYDVIEYGRGKSIDTKGMNLVFRCEKVKTEKDEKKLRSFDVLWGAPAGFIFVNDLILNCLKHLVDKDIQVIPAKIYTTNGIVKGYHLIDVINVVYGVDKERSTYHDYESFKSLDKLIPKNEDFMEGHELARENERKGSIYIIPKLREKIIKAKKGKLKGLEIRTAKENWEAGRNPKLCPY